MAEIKAAEVEILLLLVPSMRQNYWILPWTACLNHGHFQNVLSY